MDIGHRHSGQSLISHRHRVQRDQSFFVIIAAVIGVSAGAAASAQVVCLPNSPETLGGTCTSESTCLSATTRQVIYNTNCEAQGKVCCAYTASYVSTLRQACMTSGGVCKTSCAGTETANSTSCPGTEKCCVARTCDSLSGNCMTAAQCTAGGETVTEAPGCVGGLICCASAAAAAGGAAPSGGTAVLPGAGSTGSGKGKTVVGYGLTNPLGSRSINDIAAALIKYASGIAGTLMLIYMIWGGVQYMTASDQKAVQSAQQRIVWAVIGVGVIFFAYVVIDAVIRLSSLAPGA